LAIKPLILKVLIMNHSVFINFECAELSKSEQQEFYGGRPLIKNSGDPKIDPLPVDAFTHPSLDIQTQ
jgi:hypothetical protein